MTRSMRRISVSLFVSLGQEAHRRLADPSTRPNCSLQPTPGTVRTLSNCLPIPRFSRASAAGRVKLVFMERRIQRASGSPLVTVTSACRMPTSQPSQLSCRPEPRSRSSEGRRSQVVASCGISLWRPGNELMMAPASPTPSGSSVHPTMSQAAISGGPPAINT